MPEQQCIIYNIAIAVYYILYSYSCSWHTYVNNKKFPKIKYYIACAILRFDLAI